MYAGHRAPRPTQLDGEGARLIRTERSFQRALSNFRRPDRLLLAVHFAGGSDGRSKRYPDAGLRLAVEFYRAQNQFIALLGPFQRHYSNSRAADLQERKFAAEMASVLRSLEGDQRIVQSLSLPISFRRAPAISMRGKAKDELMVS